MALSNLLKNYKNRNSITRKEHGQPGSNAKEKNPRYVRRKDTSKWKSSDYRLFSLSLDSALSFSLSRKRYIDEQDDNEKLAVEFYDCVFQKSKINASSCITN